MREALRHIKMTGAILPGNSTVELREFDVPEPGPGQILVATRASTICGSDIRAIYRQHIGKGAEGYIPGTVAGHEPSGRVAKVGPGCKVFKEGDRLIGLWGTAASEIYQGTPQSPLCQLTVKRQAEQLSGGY